MDVKSGNRVLILCLFGLLLAGCAASAAPSSVATPEPVAPTLEAVPSTVPTVLSPIAVVSSTATLAPSPAPSSTAPGQAATPTAPPIQASPAAGTAVSTPGAGTVTIEIKNFSFGDDKPVTVSPGTTVIWINRDNVVHTVTADDKSFNSGDMATGAQFSHTFTTEGTYPYYCIWHGGPGGQYMSSKIIVKK